MADGVRGEQDHLHLLQAIVDHIPILLCVWDPSLNTFRFNRHFRQVLGWSEHDTLDGDFLAKVYPDPEYRLRAEAFMHSSSTEFLDLKTTARDGRLIDIAWSNIRLPHGVVVGIGVDIRQRLHAEQALAESERRFRTMADGMPGMVWVHDMRGQLEFINEGYTRFFGCNEDGARGQQWQLLLHPDDRDGYTQAFLDAVSRRQPFTARARVRRADGQWRWIESHAQPRLTDAGEALGYVGLTFDITDLIEAQRQVTQREMQLRAVTSTTPDVLSRTDRQLRHVFINEAIHAISGRRPEEFLGKTNRELGMDPALCDLWDEALEAVFRDGRARDIHFDFPTPQGVRRFKSRLVPEVGPDGRIEHVLGVARDVTEEHVREQQLHRHREELELRVTQRTMELRQRAEQLSRLTSELTLAEQRERRRLAQVLHDHLQQLLVGARLGLDVLAHRVGPEHQPAVHRANDLLVEAIDASRSLTVELSPPILHEAGLPAAIDWLARDMKARHHLDVKLDLDPDATTEHEDLRVLLFSAVRELLFNVVKHAGVKRAKVCLSQDDDHLALEVSDAGRGFDPRAPRAQTNGGFGLFSLRERLALLGGDMEVCSDGKGTRVRLRAPHQRPQDIAATDKAHDLPRVTAQLPLPFAQSTGGQFRLMLVDDHVVIREGLVALLSNEPDLEVVAQASDGHEALELAAKLNPDIVLMDFSMPRMNGVETTQRMRQMLPTTPIIGLSMFDEPDRADAMKQAGASAYLSKSGRSDLLVQTIRQLLHRTA